MSGSDFKKKFENTALALLIAGNAYFIRRLVDEIDATKQLAIQTREDVAVIKNTLSRVKMREARCDAPRKRIYPTVLELDYGGNHGNETFLSVENFLASDPWAGCGFGTGIGGFYSSQLRASWRGVGSY